MYKRISLILIGFSLSVIKAQYSKIDDVIFCGSNIKKDKMMMFTGEGEHTLYNKNHQLSQKGLYNDGSLWIGKWFRYNEDGFIACIELYEKGEYIGDADFEDIK